MIKVLKGLDYVDKGRVLTLAEIKWIKLAINMHEDEKIKLIDDLPERDTIHYIWIRILLLGGKLNANGEIFLSDGKPLNAKMLAILFSRPLEDIKLALKVLSRFEMIEIAANKVIKIVNWNKYQNVEGMEKVREQNRKRAEDFREKKKLEKKAAENTMEETNEGEPLENRIYLNEKDASKDNKFINKYETLDENTFIEDTANTKIEASSNNIESVVSNDCNIINETSNVTQNENNVPVMQQNKKEIENKKKNEKKDKDKNNKSESKEDEDINLKSLELMQYHEKITGKVCGCDYVALRAAIEIYGEKWVKMAMDVGFERNCPDIKYAIGVLKNWKRDGCPEDLKEVKKNEFRCNRKSSSADKNEFTGFKPKEPRKLTEAERRKIEANLI
jgi:phage replisome organizer, putative, N-terminal region